MLSRAHGVHARRFHLNRESKTAESVSVSERERERGRPRGFRMNEVLVAEQHAIAMRSRQDEKIFTSADTSERVLAIMIISVAT